MNYKYFIKEALIRVPVGMLFMHNGLLRYTPKETREIKLKLKKRLSDLFKKYNNDRPMLDKKKNKINDIIKAQNTVLDKIDKEMNERIEAEINKAADMIEKIITE